MADILIAELIPNPKNGGGTYEDAPWRFVFHMTQSPRGKGNARKLARVHQYPPHLWYDWENDELVQSVPLNRSAFALKRVSVQTNKKRAIQVELLGYSEDAGSIPDWGLKRIAERVLKPARDALQQHYGSTFKLEAPYPIAGSSGYGQNAKQRMSVSAWGSFNAVCNHAQVPTNDHWDTGLMNLARIVEHANAAYGERPAPTPTPTPPDLGEEEVDPSKWSDEGYRAFWANAHTKLALHNEVVTVLSGSQVKYGEKVTNLGDLYNQGSEVKALVGSIKPGGAVDPVALAALIVDGIGDDLAGEVVDEIKKRLDG